MLTTSEMGVELSTRAKNLSIICAITMMMLVCKHLGRFLPPAVENLQVMALVAQ